MQVREIITSHLLILVRAAYIVIQHIVLPRSGNTDVMTEVDQMVMFCLMTIRKINLVRLILDFILSAVHAERRRHATLPYGMFLTKVFTRAQLPLDGHRVDNKCPPTTMKTFSAMGLKPQAQDKKNEYGKRRREEEGQEEERFFCPEGCSCHSEGQVQTF